MWLTVALLVVGAGVGATGGVEQQPCAGTVAEPADATTVISVQGFNFGGDDAGKKPAMLVGVGPQGQIRWVHHSAREHDVVWAYDVDPLENGTLFVTATVPNHRTVVYEFDPETQERVWSETFDVTDTHDADLLANGEIVVANMRNNVGPNGTARDRIFVYNRTQEEIVWEWNFTDHFEPEAGGDFSNDWTHVNDVDPVGEDAFLVSPRNFDQVLLINRTTGDIDLRLGEDDDHDTLKKQHNPDYLESQDGDPTFLVADSENDRIVEYERTADGWNRTWELGTGQLGWPRDADRLPNGNTLVSDSTKHRVIEVTPDGEVVWEFYAPWLVYDAVRVGNPNESGGPTMADLGREGSYAVSGSAGLHDDPDAIQECFETLGAGDGGRTTTGEATPTTGDESTQPTTATAEPTETMATGDEQATSAVASADEPADASASGDPIFGTIVGLAALVAAAFVLLARRGDG
jgi:hypothetical protein